MTSAMLFLICGVKIFVFFFGLLDEQGSVQCLCCLHFFTAKEQLNCGVTNEPNIKSPLKDRSWFSQLSAGAAAGFTVGCMVFVAAMVATFIMVSKLSFFCESDWSLSKNKKSPLKRMFLL